MPKETFLSRYSLIIKRLEKGPATYEQILHYLENESDIQDKNFAISKRTLQRDIKDIYSQLNIEIVNEKKGDKKYFIKSKPETQEHSQRLLESYQIINAINASQDYADYVFLENRKPKGLEHFSGLLYAIKNKRVIKFTHYKYWDETITYRTVHSLALKESQGRWYLVAVDTKDNKLKTFGIDRIEDLDITKSLFRNKYHYNIKELFTHSFGILTNEKEKPETIKLSFSYEQGQYIKTYPLHASQKLIKENRQQDEVIIELHVHITKDFVMELLSFGEDLQVISPASLIDEMKNNLANTLKYY